jgi:hypothetical protein
METTTPSLSEHPWMEHEETGLRAQLPDIGYWRGNGWHPCDGPPPEPSLTRDPEPEAHEPEAPAAEEAPGLSAARHKKTAKATSTKDSESDGG